MAIENPPVGGPEDQPITHPDLIGLIINQINDTVARFYDPDDGGHSLPGDYTLADAQALSTSGYLLGLYLVEQIPYSTPSEVNLPKVPTTPLGERRRVRKTGVLKGYHSGNKLPATTSIPAGLPFAFTYEKLASLFDDEVFRDPELENGMGPDVLDGVSVYDHNVVKIIRFRYSLLNRRRNNEPRPAYLCVLYSGGDGP